MTLEALRNECKSCSRCPLSETRRNVVFGVGAEDAEVLFVGEGPGQREDETGEPFVGPAGQLLDRMLSIIGLSRKTCYIANTVKCRPPQNRDPLGTEQQACQPWLDEQIRLLRPKILVCLGRIAAMELIREDFRITKEHGCWFLKDGVWYMATYHPSALLRDVSKRPEAFADLKLLQAKVREVCTHTTADPLAET
ncbi:MAG: uracil-DNA glycosylase [Oscillospiraceae bacterium]|nr:uracil-DNA glycosylase [Oscillospiraceae bacterium]